MHQSLQEDQGGGCWGSLSKSNQLLPAHPPGLVSKGELCKGRVNPGGWPAGSLCWPAVLPVRPLVWKAGCGWGCKGLWEVGSWGLTPALPLPTLSFCQIAKQQQQLIQQQHKINLLQQQIQVRGEGWALGGLEVEGLTPVCTGAVDGERQWLCVEQSHSGVTPSVGAPVCFSPFPCFCPLCQGQGPENPPPSRDLREQTRAHGVGVGSDGSF